MNSNYIVVNTSYGVVTRTISPVLTGEVGDQEAELFWEIPSDWLLPVCEFRIYEIEENASGADIISLLTVTPPDTRNYTLTSLVNDQEYRCMITAVMS